MNDFSRSTLIAELDSPQAWMMVAASFVATFTVYGIAYTFGAFFKPMAAEFAAGPSSTSIVFSLTVCIWSLLGWPCGHFADRFGPRPVLIAGALAIGTGLILTSTIHRLWVGYLTYSVGVGVGVACGYVPTVAVVGGWFLRRRNTALGIAVAGIGCGTLAMAPIAAALIARFGWRTTDVILGICASLMLLGCAAVMKRPPVHVAPAEFRIGEALRSPAFAILYLSSMLSSMALFVPFVFLPAFARDHGASEVAAATLVGLIGGSSVIGRMGLGAIADRLGVIRLYMLCFLVVSLSYGLWLVASTYAALVIFAIVMGVGYGGWVALSPAVMAELYGIQRLGTILGAFYTGGGVGALLGPPVAGFMIEYSGGYRGAIALTFAIGIISFLVLIPLERVARSASPVPAGAAEEE